jgi:hypothetical protein
MRNFDLYCAHNIVRVMKYSRRCSAYEGEEKRIQGARGGAIG